MYLNALTGDHAAGSRLIALCDVNPGRLAHAAEVAARAGAEPRTCGRDFERMIGETSPDRVSSRFPIMLMPTISCEHCNSDVT
jgi:hypothetical protein